MGLSRNRSAPTGSSSREPSTEMVVDLARLVRVAREDADLWNVPSEDSMLDGAQSAVVYQLARLAYSGEGRIAELGAYIGGTTCLFGEALHRGGVKRRVLEVYDLFEHNDASRRRLARHPRNDPTSFLPIWTENTAPYRDLIHLCRGDLRETADLHASDLEILYVDIVKHPSVIAPVVQKFFRRLRPGSIVIHQDYFHWQSPWVVTSTERLMSYFDIVGTVSNHMLVLRSNQHIPDDMLDVDDAALAPEHLEELMRSAIERFQGIRAGLLAVSMLNLLGASPSFDFGGEAASVRDKFSNSRSGGRVLRYLDAVESARQASAKGRPLW